MVLFIIWQKNEIFRLIFSLHENENRLFFSLKEKERERERKRARDEDRDRQRKRAREGESKCMKERNGEKTKNTEQTETIIENYLIILQPNKLDQ